MAVRKAKTLPKIFETNENRLREIVLKTMQRISDAVGSSLGPSGRLALIESELPGLPNTITKDGVTIFENLGAQNSYEHLIIETARDAAKRTSVEAGDGPQPLYSKVLTPTGFISMGEIKVGMKICGTNSSIQEVLGVYPKGQKEIHQVEFSDGRVVECCSDHLWMVTYNHGKESVKTTEALLKDYKKLSSNGYFRYKYYTPNTTVEFSENKDEMPLDPYLVGLLIGDGSLSGSGSIELSLGAAKKHILDKLVLPEGIRAHTTFVENKNYYRVKLSGKTNEGDSMSDLLNTLGLFGTHSNNKFIPKSYLYSSVNTRKALLQGLLDTDGHVNTKHRFEYSTISEQLNEDMGTLTKSLGISTYNYLLERKEGSSYSETPIYRTYELKDYKYGDKIVNITPTGKFTEMQCIKVSNPDNLYITDNFIVTHNTTSATVLANALVSNLFGFCGENAKYSPQKAARRIKQVVKDILLPYIKERSILIGEDNKQLLKMVAKISANGDEDLANAVIEAFEVVGFGESSHVTIRQLSGPQSYKVERIDGLPIPVGLEESTGKLHSTFINDQANQRCYLEKPLFLLFDGHMNDLIAFMPILNAMGNNYMENSGNHKNLVIFAHGFSEDVLLFFAHNFADPGTINILPVITPMRQFLNSQTHFLHDMSAFTGSKIFGMKNQVGNAILEDLGSGMESFEAYRFRSTVVGDPDPTNVEVRASDLKQMAKNSESKAEKIWLEERLGQITNGIAKLTIFGGSNGELKESHDRAEDAILATRAAITYGALPGGCRISIDMTLKLAEELPEGDPARAVLIPALLSLPQKLLDNAGYTAEEIGEVIGKLIEDPNIVYDVENQRFGDAMELGLFDSTKAVSESLNNAVSIASVLGCMGSIICSPRDAAHELNEARLDSEYMAAVNNADKLVNEADLRP